MQFTYTLVVMVLLLSLGTALCIRTYRKGDGAYRALYVALFFLALCASFLFKLSAEPPAVNAFVPFYKLFALKEYGYASILKDLLTYAVPFVLAGFLLIPAYTRASLLTAFSIGTLSSLLFNVYPLFIGSSFITDEYIYAGIGCAFGAALYVIFAGLFKKRLPLAELRLPVPLHKRYVNSIVLFAVVYLGVALVMVFDFGEAYAPIQFFESDTPLPQTITLDCELGAEGAKANIFVPSNVPANEKAAQLAQELSIDGAVEYQDGTYTVSDANAKLNLTDSGSWVYEYTGEVSGDVPNADEARAAVIAFFEEHELLTVELDEITDTVERLSESGAAEGYDVYLSTMINSMPIIGSSTLVVSVRAGGAITKIRRYDGDILASTIVNIISQQKAYEKIALGECAYTLFTPALSASIESCGIIYVANSSQGYYLPVWMFSCSAELEDGTRAPFDIYVEAMK